MSNAIDEAQPANRNVPAQDPRVYLAAERTLLAWVRTGLSLMGFGFVVARFGLFLRELAAARGGAANGAATAAERAVEQVLRHEQQRPSASLWIGIVLVAAGVLVNVLAGLDHARVVRSLRRGDTHPATKSTMAVVLALVLAVLGVVMAAYLLSVSR